MEVNIKISRTVGERVLILEDIDQHSSLMKAANSELLVPILPEFYKDGFRRGTVVATYPNSRIKVGDKVAWQKHQQGRLAPYKGTTYLLMHVQNVICRFNESQKSN